MANKDFYVNIDLKKQSIIDAKINPLTDAARGALSLGVGDAGYSTVSTDDGKLYVWNGSAFTTWSIPTGAMVYQGSTSSLTTAPTTVTQGSTYVYTGASGTLTWAGVSFSPSAVVQPQDLIIFRNATTVDIYQGNDVTASETVAGNIQLATQTEVNTGTDVNKAVTSATLASHLSSRGTPKAFISTGLSLAANTALTISFPTTASNKDAFSVSLKDSSGSEFVVDVDAVSTAGFTVTSNVAVAGVTAFVTYL